MFERFTDRARRVVVLAQEQSRRLGHNYIGTEHLLLGLSKETEGVAGTVLIDMGFSPDSVEEKLMTFISPGEDAPTGHIPFTPRAKKVLELSLREALQLGHDYIGTEHILLGLLREGEGVGAQVIRALGGEFEDIRAKILEKLNIDPSLERKRPWIGRRPRISISTSVFNERALSEPVKRLLSFAIEEAEARGADKVELQDILVSLFKEQGTVPHRVFETLDLSSEAVRELINRLTEEEQGEAGSAS